MLGWSQQKLATEADIARSTLALIEKVQDDVNNASRAKVQKTLEEGGIEFLPPEGNRGEGVRRNPVAERHSI
jgi:hypothetical protein